LVTEPAVKRRVPQKNLDFFLKNEWFSTFSTNNTCHVFRIGLEMFFAVLPRVLNEVFSSGGCREGGEPLEGAGSTWASDLAPGGLRVGHLNYSVDHTGARRSFFGISQLEGLAQYLSR